MWFITAYTVSDQYIFAGFVADNLCQITGKYGWRGAHIISILFLKIWHIHANIYQRNKTLSTQQNVITIFKTCSAWTFKWISTNFNELMSVQK